MCSVRGFFLELAPRIDEKHVGHTLKWNNFWRSLLIFLLMPFNNIYLQFSQYLIHWSMNYFQKFSCKQRCMEITILLQKSNPPIVWREQELSNVAFSLTPFHFLSLGTSINDVRLFGVNFDPSPPSLLPIVRFLPYTVRFLNPRTP